MRLKKFGFTFNIRRLISNFPKEPDREKNIKVSIFFYHDEENSNFSQEHAPSDSMTKNFFILEFYFPGIDEKRTT